ncbi:MAG: MFS transporter, partial [Pseudomonadales bacterium]
LLSEESLVTWGWRVPFVIGAVLAVVVFWIRRNLDESRAFNSQRRKRLAPAGATTLFITHWRPTLLVFVITVVGSTGFYVYIGYMQKFLVNSSGFHPETAARLMTTALVLFLFLQPLFGWISDYVGRRRVLVASFGLMAIITAPTMRALSTTTAPFEAFLLLMLLLIAFSGYTALGAVVKAELFPSSIRALGVGVPYALANAIFGGSGEFLALWSKQAGYEELFFYYMAALMLLGMIASLFLPDSREVDLIG